MINYEKIADEAAAEIARDGEPAEAMPLPQTPFGMSKAALDTFRDTVLGDSGEVIDPSAQSALNREYFPVNHPRYAGIAEAKGYRQGENRLQRTHYSHEAMIDVIVAEPTLTQRELAKRFERTENWISTVMGSDAFQAALAKRRDEVTDPFLIATVEERFRGLADQSLRVISDKLAQTQSADLALKALDISAKALGFGARAAGPGAVIQNSFVVQLPNKAEDSTAWLAGRSGGVTIDAEPSGGA